MAHPAPSESHTPAGERAAPSTPIAARAPVALAALTTHDDFLLELGEALGGRASVHPAESIDAALEQLDAGRGGQILAIDAREAGDLRTIVERTGKQAPHALILVFTEAGEEKTVAATVKGTKVFTVLPLPMEPDKTAAVLGTALEQALEHANSQGAPHATQTPDDAPTRAPEEAGTTEPPRGGRGRWLWVAAAVGALGAAGAGWYLIARHHASPSRPVTHAPLVRSKSAAAARTVVTGPSVDTSIVQGHIDELLEKASRAMFARHFTSPRGANALVYFRSALAVDPSNGEARAGLRRVSHVLISRFRNDFAAGHYNRAALALATLRLAEPHDMHLRPFGIQLSTTVVNQALAGGHLSTVPALLAQAARRGVPAAQLTAWQTQLARLQSKQRIHTLARQITRRIAADRLTGPAGAQATLAELRVIAPGAPATRKATRALIDVLLHRARAAGLAGRSDALNSWLADARATGASAADIAAVKRQLSEAAHARAAQARLEKLLAQARAHLAAGALLHPDNASAAHDLTAIAATDPKASEAAAASRLRHELAHALVRRAETEARAGHPARARADLLAARHWGATATTLHALTALAHTAVAPTAAQLAAVAQRLRRVHYVAPVYPQRALSQGVSGKVTVQYVVNKGGRTRKLQVVAAQPSTIFNRAALDAVRRWRYTPPKLNGKLVDVPVRITIRFVLPQ